MLANQLDQPTEAGTTHGAQAHNGMADFARSIVKSSIQDPINGVSQLINHVTDSHLPPINIVAKPDDTWWSTAGSIVGNAIDFVGISTLTGGGSGLLQVALRTGAAGAMFELSRPVEPSSNYWAQKGKDAAVGFASFAAMGGASAAIARTTLFGAVGARSIYQDMEAGAASALPGGATSVELDSLLNGKGLASSSDVARGALQFAAFGAVSAGLSHALTSFRQPDIRDDSHPSRSSSDKTAVSDQSDSKNAQPETSAKGTNSSARKSFVQIVGDDGFAYTKGLLEWERTRFPVGTKVNAYPDGTYEATFPNGTKLEQSNSWSTDQSRITRPDGTEIERIEQWNGIKTTTTKLTDGTIITNEGGVTKTAKPDGTVITSDNGPIKRTVTESPDGTKELITNNGERITTLPDGTRTSQGPKGRIFTQKPDGTRIWQDPTGKLREKPGQKVPA